MGSRGPRSKLEPYDEDIRRMYVEEGLTDKAIAEALPVEVSPDSVAIRRKRLGIKTSRNKKVGRFSAEAKYEQVKDELPAAWERSKRMHKTQKRMVGSAARVGKEFGVSQATANKWLKRHGLVESLSHYPEGSREKAAELFREGLSVPKVSEVLGTPYDATYRWIKESGADLSGHPTTRMNHEELMSWRSSIREARGRKNPTEGRYSYNGEAFDSPQEIILVSSCDRLGVEWKKVDRAEAVEWADEEGDTHLYAPDINVAGIDVEVKGFYGTKDHKKVSQWREVRGELSLVDEGILPQLEAASSPEHLVALVKANCYYTPEVNEAEWRV